VNGSLLSPATERDTRHETRVSEFLSLLFQSSPLGGKRSCSRNLPTVGLAFGRRDWITLSSCFLSKTARDSNSLVQLVSTQRAAGGSDRFFQSVPLPSNATITRLRTAAVAIRNKQA
jgi:hypothetical protein